MVALSKHQVMRALENVSCQQLVHPWTSSCTRSCLELLVVGLRGTYKFFLIMYLAQIVQNGRKVTRTYLLNQMRGFVWSLMLGVTCCSIVIASVCFLRNGLGKFYYLTVVCLPGIVAGFIGILWEVPERRTLYAFTFVQMCVEYFIRVLEASKFVSLTRGRETLAFMIFNAVLLYLLRTDTTKKPGYWFFRPAKSVDKEENPANDSRCHHLGSCWKFVLKSSSKYMGIGLGIQVLRIILTKSKLMLREPKKTLIGFLFDKKTFELGSFLGAYIGIYGSVTCLLSQYYGSSFEHHVLPAGFFAGCAYWLHPNRTFGAAVLTNTLHLLLQRAVKSGKIPVLPLASEIAFAVSLGILFHARFMYAKICPRFITNLLTTFSKGRVDDVYKNLLEIVVKFHK